MSFVGRLERNIAKLEKNIEKEQKQIEELHDKLESKKITSAEFTIKKKRIEAKTRAMDSRMRVGIGYDVHALVSGRRLVLGGLEIPYDLGLDGHSDADVIIHAFYRCQHMQIHRVFKHLVMTYNSGVPPRY